MANYSGGGWQSTENSQANLMHGYGAPQHQQPQPYAAPYAQQPQPQQYGQQQQYGGGGYGQQYQQQPQAYATPYAPQQTAYPPPQGPPPPPVNMGEKFQKTSKYKDVWAAVVFFLTMAGFAACAVKGLSNLHAASKNTADNNTNNGNSGANNNKFVVPPPGDTAGILVACVGTGFLLSVLYFLAMQRFAGKLIKFSLVMNVVILIALAAYFATQRQFVATIIWLLFAALSAFFLWSWRSRIPLAKIILKTVTSVTGQFPATLFAGFIGLVLITIFNALWLATFAGMMQVYDDKSSNGARYAVVVFLLFALYYASQVISNVVHVTVAGLFASYYFMGQPGGAQGKVTIPMANPTAQSAKRALTTSFGSVCFGSLVIAILQTIRAILRMAQNDAASDGNLAGALCAACAGCCLGIIEDLIQYFNKWAFCQVAIYGTDYITAAKNTWALCKSRGVDAIINDQLIGSVLGVGGIVVSFICGFVAFLYVRFSPNIPNDSAHYAVFIILAVFLGASEFFVLSNVIDSGSTATFVCLAEDPAALQRTKPQLYEAIRAVYPQVGVAGGY
ncbi:putative choline transporter, neither null mutation nor overexpression affects choline transport [Geranomyces variabilis]|uniref:Protein PNS1 n=1 Tax=Geranomyces variabilis TaxID=109894 RepID=A0AAD5TFW8_9FUNG|nr:putative choline transporter, neither null mutation nor overexpression affects choline transport [Geranomyces variabilis]